MHSRNVLFLAVILVSSSMLALAQSPAGAVQQDTSSLTTVPNPPRDSRAQIPPLSGKNQPPKPGTLRVIVFGNLPQTISVQPNQNPVCYSMRSYNYGATDPTSGVTKFKGVTTCELASNSHLKDASDLSSK